MCATISFVGSTAPGCQKCTQLVWINRIMKASHRNLKTFQMGEEMGRTSRDNWFHKRRGRLESGKKQVLSRKWREDEKGRALAHKRRPSFEDGTGQHIP